MSDLPPRRQRVRLVEETPADSLVHDRLEGAGPIATFWCGRDTPKNRKRVYNLVARGIIPAGKLGGIIIASRRKLAAAYDAMTSGKQPE